MAEGPETQGTPQAGAGGAAGKGSAGDGREPLLLVHPGFAILGAAGNLGQKNVGPVLADLNALLQEAIKQEEERRRLNEDAKPLSEEEKAACLQRLLKRLGVQIVVLPGGGVSTNLSPYSFSRLLILQDASAGAERGQPDTNPEPESEDMPTDEPDRADDPGPPAIVSYISPLAYVRSVWAIIWGALRHPFSTTVVDLSTGEAVHLSAQN